VYTRLSLAMAMAIGGIEIVHWQNQTCGSTLGIAYFDQA
jgi:hypothetical protein